MDDVALDLKNNIGRGKDKMTGLLLKDLLNLKRLAKQYLLILAVMCVWAAAMKNAGFVSLYMTLCASMLVLTSFSYDEYAHFERYALTMPVDRRMLVREKYLLMFLLVAGGTILGMVLGGVMALVFKGEMEELLVTSLVIGCVFMNVYSLIIPVIYKLGVEKARMVMIVAYMGLFVGVFGTAKLLKATGVLGTMGEPAYLETLIPAVAMAVTAIVFACSYFVSLRVVGRREW